jgi:hypothetical protein
MPRRPDDTEPDPPGGRAAERLREFVEQRFPGGVPAQEGARKDAEDRAGERGDEHAGAGRQADEPPARHDPDDSTDASTAGQD